MSEEARRRIREAYDPALFRERGLTLIERLAEHFRQSQQVPGPAVNWIAPADRVERARRSLERREEFGALVDAALEGAHRFQSPRYLGHQVPPPLPVAGLFDAMASITNQGGALYEMSPFFTAAERALVEELGRRIGWSAGYDGIGTSGGTLANLTAVLTARNVRYGDSWTRGVAPAGKTPAIVVGEDAHYSIARAAGILGIGTDNVWKVPGDERRRMRRQAVDDTLDRAARAGHEVFCIVAAAGSTPVGAFDCLGEIADVAGRRGIWFHVDGAHGASVLMSERHRHLADGVAAADSVTWDAHKMLFVPSLSTFLLYRDGRHSFRTFQQEAPYLFDPNESGYTAYDGGLRTVECTKHTLAAGLWGAWCLHGPGLFADLVDVTFALTRELYDLVRATPGFEALHEPQSNILCFRARPSWEAQAPPGELDRLHGRLRRRLIEEAGFYVTGTTLDGKRCLRVTVMNPLVERAQFEGLLAEASRLAESGKPG